MKSKVLVFALAVLVINLACVTSAPASTRAEKEAQFADRVKAAIFKLGTGPDARIKLKLRNKTTISGYVSEAGEDGFVVVDSKTGAPTRVDYPQVAQAKGNNFSTGQKIAIVVAIGVIVWLAVEMVKIGRN